VDDIGVKTSIKGVDRSLYTEHYHNGDIEVGYWSWDRASSNKADPGRWLAYQDDGPWAPLWGHWYHQDPWAKQEPPADHWIRAMWDLWEKVQGEADEAKNQALFMQIINMQARLASRGWCAADSSRCARKTSFWQPG